LTLASEPILQRQYHLLDVFTQKPLSGNPLAVVSECAGLDAAEMQAIAAELNLSETAFVLPPRERGASARLRIFTPKAELPFAGHPTIGAAVLLTEPEAGDEGTLEDSTLVLEEEIGTVRCRIVRRAEAAAFASFDLPHLPVETGAPAAAASIAAALGLDERDIGFAGHRPSLFSAGLPCTFIPVAGLATIARARPDPSVFDTVFCGLESPVVYLYTKDTVEPGHAFHARMFAPALGIAEDPATGSAAAALAGVLATFEQPADGCHTYLVEQGFEMGRPSRITLSLEILHARLASVSIGGHAVVIARGTLDL
jgi:trans-2,3-dihydro-3-hydroxyanthranilate isomerase